MCKDELVAGNYWESQYYEMTMGVKVLCDAAGFGWRFGADHRGLVWDSIDSDFLDFGLIAHAACTGADEYGLDKKMGGGLPTATAGTNRFGGTDS